MIGVASLAYNPLGYDDGVDPLVGARSRDACIRVLVCGGSGARTAGQPGG